MTKDVALNTWFNQALFKAKAVVVEEENGEYVTHIVNTGEHIPFYPSTSVPDDVVFPYGTYELITSAWEGGEVGLTVNLWFYTESEAIPTAKAEELSVKIGRSGINLPCKGGYIKLMRGSPWCQSLKDETSDVIKRRYINVTARYYTEN